MGIAEGSIRIWRNYEVPNGVELACNFRAISDTLPVGHTSGVLTAWEQQKGHLLVGGDMRHVRLWDATIERHIRVCHAFPFTLYAPKLMTFARIGFPNASGGKPHVDRCRSGIRQCICRWIW